jgi:hypothetical protein
MMVMIKLLTKQFETINADEVEQDEQLINIEREIKEVFVSRQDVSTLY